MRIYKGLYLKIKEDAENQYIEDFLDDKNPRIEDCIEDALYYNEELLADILVEEHDVDDETLGYLLDDLQEEMFLRLVNEISTDELEESVEYVPDLWGLSAEARNPDIFRAF